MAGWLAGVLRPGNIKGHISTGGGGLKASINQLNDQSIRLLHCTNTPECGWIISHIYSPCMYGCMGSHNPVIALITFVVPAPPRSWVGAGSACTSPSLWSGRYQPLALYTDIDRYMWGWCIPIYKWEYPYTWGYIAIYKGIPIHIWSIQEMRQLFQDNTTLPTTTLTYLIVLIYIYMRCTNWFMITHYNLWVVRPHLLS